MLTRKGWKKGDFCLKYIVSIFSRVKGWVIVNLEHWVKLLMLAANDVRNLSIILPTWSLRDFWPISNCLLNFCANFGEILIFAEIFIFRSLGGQQLFLFCKEYQHHGQLMLGKSCQIFCPRQRGEKHCG